MRLYRSLTALVVCLPTAGCNEFEISVPTFAEVFTQSPWDKVDVLLVVDNSGSMAPYQEKLSTDFGGFFEFFAQGEVDWQLAVVHTDGNDPTLGRIRGPVVTTETLDPEALFAEIVNVGTQGGGLEVGLEAAARALANPSQDFPREDASTSVIFVSDEQDSSPYAVAEYVNDFYELHGQRARHSFNASALTVTELADCTPEQFQASSQGTRYIEAARLTGGITANLCVDDFREIVLQLALTTSTVLDTFYLRDRPDLNTLIVRVEGEEIPCDAGVWTYQLVDREGALRPAIVFSPEHLPAPSAEILAEYQRGNGDVEAFCPEVAP
jgi:hypothetical protein